MNRWRHIVAVLFALTLVQLGRLAIDRCVYDVSGDALVFLEDAHALRTGYVSGNLAARLAGEPPPQRLAVEAGFPAALALMESFHIRAPFLLNAFLLPFLVLALAAAARSPGADPDVTLCTAALTLGLWLAIPGDNEFAIWSMTALIRDPLAHLLGFAGLACALAPRNAAAWTAGILVGLAAWTRLPNILFAAPALLGIALLHKSCRTARVARLAGGVAIGLLPLLAQNALEAKPVHHSGQGAMLVAKDSEPPAKPRQPSAKHGLAAGHLLPHLPDFAHRLADRLPFPFWLAALAAAGTGLASGARRRGTVVLLCGGLLFFLFYCAYSRFVPRYHAVTILFLLLLIGRETAQGVARLASGRRGPILAGTTCAALLCVLIATQANAHDPARNRAVWRDALRFRDWAATHIAPTDTVLANHQVARAWLLALSPMRGSTLSWPADLGRKRRAAKAQALLEASTRTRFLAVADKHGVEYPSWWKDDMRNVVDVAQHAPLLALDSIGHTLVLHDLVPRPLARTIEIPAGARGATTLLLVHALPGEAETIEARIHDEAGGDARSVRLQAGPNWLVLPDDSFASGSLRIEADGPLPNLRILAPEPDGTVAVHFTRYAEWPTAQVWLRGAALRWTGYPHWARDWGGFGIEKQRSRPFFVLNPDANLRLPPTGGDLEVRLHFRQEPENGGPPRHAPIGVSIGDAPLASPLSKEIEGPKWTQHVVVPAKHLSGAPGPLLRLHDAATDTARSVALVGVDFGPTRKDDP